MRESLHDEVRAFLLEHGSSTATSIAVGVRARRVEVDDVLAGGGFARAARPEGTHPLAVFFSVSEPVPARRGGKSRAAVMLAVLRDGRRHSREDIFRATGRYFLTNNAAAELRAQGHDIRHAKQGRVDLYWLNVSAERPAALEAVSSSRASGEAVPMEEAA